MDQSQRSWLTRVVAAGFIVLIVMGNLCLVYNLTGRPLPSALYVAMVTGLVTQAALCIAATTAHVVSRLRA